MPTRRSGTRDRERRARREAANTATSETSQPEEALARPLVLDPPEDYDARKRRREGHPSSSTTGAQ